MRAFCLLGSPDVELRAHSPRNAAMKLACRHGGAEPTCMRILDVVSQKIHVFEVRLVPLESDTPYTLQHNIHHRAIVSKLATEKVGDARCSTGEP